MPSGPPDATVTLTQHFDGDRMKARLNILRPDSEPLFITLEADALFRLALNALEIVSDIKGLRRL